MFVLQQSLKPEISLLPLSCTEKSAVTQTSGAPSLDHEPSTSPI